MVSRSSCCSQSTWGNGSVSILAISLIIPNAIYRENLPSRPRSGGSTVGKFQRKWGAPWFVPYAHWPRQAIKISTQIDNFIAARN